MNSSKLLQGCGKTDVIPYEDDYVSCGVTEDNGELLLCDTCKAQAQTLFDCLSEELIWLEDISDGQHYKLDEIRNGDGRNRITFLLEDFTKRISQIKSELKILEPYVDKSGGKKR